MEDAENLVLGGRGSAKSLSSELFLGGSAEYNDTLRCKTGGRRAHTDTCGYSTPDEPELSLLDDLA